jgi:hypothetical protein
MTPKRVLLETIQREPGNKLACCATADLLEEEGWLDLAFSSRWMGGRDREPGQREGSRLRKRFVGWIGRTARWSSRVGWI